MSRPKRKLIDKYNIPLNHIDFDYVKKCNNVRELEKILQILYSGEEGYFVELTKCTEQRLKLLAPNSKCFRTESEILKKDHVAKSEWEQDGEPVLEWSDEVKVKDNFLSVIANEKGPELSVPEIRGKNKRIGFTKAANEKLKKKENSDVNKTKKDDSKRIKSTDYNAWDKYDAETECLKMELDEERRREENERIKLKKEKEKPKIEEITTPINSNKEIFDNLTNVEKETLSLKFKDRGNDYFRTKEYESALIEYTKCIEIYPTSIVYNNRAITYMKLLEYNKALEDLDKCLEIDPKNIKALLRKAESLKAIDKRRDAYDIYTKIISIEPSNVAARNGLNDLNKQIPIQPPATATRISIKEEEDETSDQAKLKSIKFKTDGLELQEITSDLTSNNKTEELQIPELTSSSNNKTEELQQPEIKSSSNDNYKNEIINKPSELTKLVGSSESKSDKITKDSNNVKSKEEEELIVKNEPKSDTNTKHIKTYASKSVSIKEKDLIESSESKSNENTKEINSSKNVITKDKELSGSSESKSDKDIKEKTTNEKVCNKTEELVKPIEPKPDQIIKEPSSKNSPIPVDDKSKQNSHKNIHAFISSLTHKFDEKISDLESKKIEEKNEKNKENIQQVNQETNPSNQKSAIKNPETGSNSNCNSKKNQLEIKQTEKEQKPEIKSNKDEKISKSFNNSQQTLVKSEETKPKESQKIPKTPTPPTKQIVENKKPKKKNKTVDDDDYVQEDLAKLIIPKKIIRNKFAKTLDAFKNNKLPLPLPLPNMNNNQNKSENFHNTKTSINRIPKSPTTSKTDIKLLPDKSKNQMFIKELR